MVETKNNVMTINNKFALSSGFPGCSAVKHPPANAGDSGYMGFISGSGIPLEKVMSLF